MSLRSRVVVCEVGGRPRILAWDWIAAMSTSYVRWWGGMLVGMATNIPPHNLGEVIDGVVAAIDNPKITSRELTKIIKGPDFPTAAQILGRAGIRDAYETGRGSIKMRGVTHIEENSRGRQQIVVTEGPYQVNPASMLVKVAQLRQDKRLPEIPPDPRTGQTT